MPMIGPPSLAGSMPIARKCARAGARSALSRNPVRARRRRASTGASVTPSTVLHVAGSVDAHRDRSDARRAEACGGRGRRDLLSLVQAGVDPRDIAVGAAVAGELAAPLQPGKIVAIGLNYLDRRVAPCWGCRLSLTHDPGVREDVEGVAARRRGLGDDRALVARLERVPR